MNVEKRIKKAMRVLTPKKKFTKDEQSVEKLNKIADNFGHALVKVFKNSRLRKYSFDFGVGYTEDGDVRLGFFDLCAEKTDGSEVRRKFEVCESCGKLAEVDKCVICGKKVCLKCSMPEQRGGGMETLNRVCLECCKRRGSLVRPYFNPAFDAMTGRTRERGWAEIKKK